MPNTLRKHKLLTKEIEGLLPPIQSNESIGLDAPVVVKFFSPYSGWRWYASEGERTEDGDVEFFGLVTGFENELGSFRLSELEDAKVAGSIPAVERDLWYSPKSATLREAMDRADTSHPV